MANYKVSGDYNKIKRTLYIENDVMAGVSGLRWLFTLSDRYRISPIVSISLEVLKSLEILYMKPTSTNSKDDFLKHIKKGTFQKVDYKDFKNKSLEFNILIFNKEGKEVKNEKYNVENSYIR